MVPVITKQSLETNKLFIEELKKRGYDGIVYMNRAEGFGARFSVTLIDEKSVKPLHEVVPSLQKMKEKLRERVYNLLSLGVPLPVAIKAVQDEEGSDDGA